MRVLSIIYETMADGPGIRNVLFVAGCDHNCSGCHNPESWDFRNGKEVTEEVLAEKLCSSTDDNVNVTISGGDPMYQPRALLKLCRLLRARGKNIWVYTGFKIEDLNELQKMCLEYIDALVDGPYIESLNDGLSEFRGSSNQRIIYNPSKFMS